MTAEDLPLIMALYSDGLSLKCIAEKFELSPGTVARWVRNYSAYGDSLLTLNPERTAYKGK